VDQLKITLFLTVKPSQQVFNMNFELVCGSIYFVTGFVGSAGIVHKFRPDLVNDCCPYNHLGQQHGRDEGAYAAFFTIPLSRIVRCAWIRINSAPPSRGSAQLTRELS
jgi:hypothetical protein